MTVTFTGFCDALLTDLTTNVDALRDSDLLVHRYAPWDPEQFSTEGGNRHLAVWPAAEATESATPLVTGPGGDQLAQVYNVLYWESSGDEVSRGIADTEAAAALLNLLQAVRDRFYALENQPPTGLGGAELIRYIGAALPERPSSARWFQIGVQVRTSVTVS